MFKKQALLIPLLAVVLILSSCGQRNLPTDKPMDDGSRFYRNEVLEFSLILPSSFEFYQTQRIGGIGFTDLEILVPTSDLGFGKKVPGYAEPIVVRAFEKKTWDEVSQDENLVYKKVGEKQDKIYTIAFWEFPPKDWEDKWNEEVENTIINNFKIE